MRLHLSCFGQSEGRAYVLISNLEKVYDLMQAYLTQEIIIIIRKKSEWSKGQNYTFVTGMSNNLDRAPNLFSLMFQLST